MRVAVVEKIGELVIKDIDEPKLLPDSILVRIESCAICGSDLRLYKKGDKRAKYPQIIGHEIAGVVDKVGTNVDIFSVGDKVTVAPGISCGECYYCKRGIGNQCLRPLPPIGYAEPGGFAQYIVPSRILIEQGFVNMIPKGLSFDEAALAELLACCINGQEIVNVGKGDTVLIIGAGPAGCMHVELARIRGAEKIMLAQRSPMRLKFAQRFHADVLIDNSSDGMVEKVLEETDGRGADVIIVACASRYAQEKSLQVVAPRGRISFFGGLSGGDTTISIDANIIHYKECLVTGASSSTGRHNKEALNLLSNGTIDARDFITHILPLERLKEGFDLMEKREAMKIIIKPWIDIEAKIGKMSRTPCFIEEYCES